MIYLGNDVPLPRNPALEHRAHGIATAPPSPPVVGNHEGNLDGGGLRAHGAAFTNNINSLSELYDSIGYGPINTYTNLPDNDEPRFIPRKRRRSAGSVGYVQGVGGGYGGYPPPPQGYGGGPVAGGFMNPVYQPNYPGLQQSGYPLNPAQQECILLYII